MTVSEARTLLSTAENTDRPWRANPGITQTQAIGIMVKGIADKEPSEVLSDLFKKRVKQAALNQCCPRA